MKICRITRFLSRYQTVIYGRYLRYFSLVLLPYIRHDSAVKRGLLEEQMSDGWEQQK
jgi:hypothetical protein